MDDFTDYSVLSKERTLFLFNTLGIPHLLSLGKVELLKSAPSIEPHVHKNSFEICVHYDGRQYYEIDKVGYETKAGDIFLSFPNEHHSTGNQREEKSRFFYIIFECTRETKNFLGLNDDESDYIVNKLFSVKSRIFPGSRVIRPIFDEVIQLYYSTHPLRLSRIKSLIFDFFYQLCMLIDSDMESVMPQDINFICDYLDSCIAETPSVHELAAMVFLSDSQFKRKFKKYTAYSPHDYIMRNKINLAKDILLYTYMPITQIAHELGISSSQMFSKVFKKYTGKTPTEFREKRC